MAAKVQALTFEGLLTRCPSWAHWIFLELVSLIHDLALSMLGFSSLRADFFFFPQNGDHLYALYAGTEYMVFVRGRNSVTASLSGK